MEEEIKKIKRIMLNEELTEVTIEMKKYWKVKTNEEVLNKIFKLAAQKIKEEQLNKEKAPAYIKKTKLIINELLDEHPDKEIEIVEVINKIEIYFGSDDRTIKKYLNFIIQILIKQDVKFIDLDNNIWYREDENKGEDKNNRIKEEREDYKEIYY